MMQMSRTVRVVRVRMYVVHKSQSEEGTKSISYSPEGGKSCTKVGTKKKFLRRLLPLQKREYTVLHCSEGLFTLRNEIV